MQLVSTCLSYPILFIVCIPKTTLVGGVFDVSSVLFSRPIVACAKVPSKIAIVKSSVLTGVDTNETRRSVC